MDVLKGFSPNVVAFKKIRLSPFLLFSRSESLPTGSLAEQRSHCTGDWGDWDNCRDRCVPVGSPTLSGGIVRVLYMIKYLFPMFRAAF